MAQQPFDLYALDPAAKRAMEAEDRFKADLKTKNKFRARPRTGATASAPRRGGVERTADRLAAFGVPLSITDAIKDVDRNLLGFDETAQSLHNIIGGDGSAGDYVNAALSLPVIGGLAAKPVEMLAVKAGRGLARAGERALASRAGRYLTEARPVLDNADDAIETAFTVTPGAQRLALPKPPPPLRAEDYEDAIESADVGLSGDAARAVTDFVGHEPETYRKGLGTGFGVMSPARLERAFSENAAAEDLAVRRQLQQAFDPVRATLRNAYGDAVKLYRHQGPTSYFDEAPEARNVLSWTAQPEVAETFAGLRDLPKSPDIVPEDVIRQAEEAMAREGRAAAGRWSFVRNPEYPEYVDLYRDGEHITDTDNVRQFLEGENEYAAARAAELEAERQRRMQNIVEAYVPLDDVVWATNRAGQHEFMVRNRPGVYYGIDKKGRLGGSDYKRGGLAVKRKNG